MLGRNVVLKTDSRYLLAAAGVLISSSCVITIANGAAAPNAPAGPSFILSSSTFEDGGTAPVRMAFKANAEFPDCFGENVSPQLSWINPPAGLKSYALTMYELEGGPAHSDLVVYGIPVNVTSFAEGELSQSSAKFIGGKALRTPGTWRGMCPPKNVGTATHHYVFRVRATDLDPKALPAGLTGEQLDLMLQGHVKGSSYITAKFKRPQ
jgi:phosphatidylethanolamine-binding protein (PEBP) family uncharacterized protein